MNWTPLTELDQLNEVDSLSAQKPVLIFKHSTQCNISAAALGRLERAWTVSDDAAHPIYFLDLLKHRDISNAIAERYGVEHESPQALVIRNGKCVQESAHFGITYNELVTALSK
ncbi:MAG: bacillithiol system redox-active protein YtxJ [Flavobacteriales bacterium]|nr:bacillithiol system redox-active protein YtxJ [Flavobacteriales bacterium]